MPIKFVTKSAGDTLLAADWNDSWDLVESDFADKTLANTFTPAQTFTGGVIISADSTFSDGVDLALGTTTGTRWGTAANQKQAFFGANPVVQPPLNEDMRTSFIGLGLIAGGVNPLNLNGGALAVGAASFSGLISGGAAGSAFALKRFALTFPSDADYTLAVGERDAIVIDVQTGVLTATRAIIVPGTASGFYIVINRNGQSVTLKTSGGTGITVATLRTAIIYFPGGVNAFRLTPDTDYSV